jgi:glycogen debranching enzyme
MWKAPDVELWGITKPPTHGWCLLKLMEIGEINHTTLEWLYPRLVKWTEYWFNERDEDNDGIPNYTEDGCDSGMDNSTVFDVGGKLETPDLSSYLVIQMQALAVVARKLGDEEAARSWELRSKNLLAGLYDHFWKNDKFVCVESGTHKYDPEPTGHLILIPLVLGADLDKGKFDKCIADLESRFLSDYGIASEALNSKKYETGSYWRGPIWASADCLIVDGLRRGGREDLAKEIAQRYCDMIKYQAGGHYENFDPKTGQGHDAISYIWSVAVHLYFMSEYLS